ncbi:hypothetical protein cypCar_00030733 [Cyprinus carpio]|nr:hypothetical protein cypCar_00030733 [Cyprinus carpio]
MSQTGAPPRWKNCPRRGQPVAGKFLPMKTMLGPRYDDKVPEENSHAECPAAETTEMFIRLCEHFIEKTPTELIGKTSQLASDSFA